MRPTTIATIEEIDSAFHRAKTYLAFAKSSLKWAAHWGDKSAEASAALKAAHAEGSEQGVIDARADVRRFAARKAAETTKARGCLFEARENLAEAVRYDRDVDEGYRADKIAALSADLKGVQAQ